MRSASSARQGRSRRPSASSTGTLQPSCARFPGLAAVQRPDPGVAQLAALRQPLAERPVEGEAEPPGQLARGPVAAVGPPDDGPQPALVEAPREQQPQRPLHDAGPADAGVRPVGDLRAAVALVPQRDRAGVPPVVLDREAPLAVLDPARGHDSVTNPAPSPSCRAAARSSTAAIAGPGTARRSRPRRPHGGRAASRRRRSGWAPCGWWCRACAHPAKPGHRRATR